MQSWHFRTPYWVSALYTLYLEFFPNTTQQSFGSAFIYLMYGIHALPYFNSASNFILYGLLNSQVGCTFLNNKTSEISKFKRKKLWPKPFWSRVEKLVAVSKKGKCSKKKFFEKTFFFPSFYSTCNCKTQFTIHEIYFTFQKIQFQKQKRKFFAIQVDSCKLLVWEIRRKILSNRKSADSIRSIRYSVYFAT